MQAEVAYTALARRCPLESLNMQTGELRDIVALVVDADQQPEYPVDWPERARVTITIRLENDEYTRIDS